MSFPAPCVSRKQWFCRHRSTADVSADEDITGSLGSRRFHVTGPQPHPSVSVESQPGGVEWHCRRCLWAADEHHRNDQEFGHRPAHPEDDLPAHAQALGDVSSGHRRDGHRRPGQRRASPRLASSSRRSRSGSRPKAHKWPLAIVANRRAELHPWAPPHGGPGHSRRWACRSRPSPARIESRSRRSRAGSRGAVSPTPLPARIFRLLLVCPMLPEMFCEGLLNHK